MAELKKAAKAVIDFTNVRERGPFNPKHIEAGDYLAKVTAVYDTPTKDKAEPQWSFALQLVDNASIVYPYRCKLDADNAWKIRNLLEAAGKSVPKKRVAVDPNVVVGSIVGLTLEDDEYNGKMKSNINAIFSAKDFAGDDEDAEDDVEEEIEEEDEEPEPPKRKAPVKKAAATTTRKAPVKKKPEPEPEEEEEDVDDVDDIAVSDEDMDELEIEDL